MNSLARRVQKVEEKLNVNTDCKLVCITIRRAYKKGTAAVFTEPVEEWLTFRKAHDEALARQKETGRGSLLFVTDALKEREARSGLPEGLLRGRKETGNIPFDQLPEKAASASRQDRVTKGNIR